MWLSGSGVRLADEGYVDPIQTVGAPPVAELHDAAAILEFAGDGVLTFSY